METTNNARTLILLLLLFVMSRAASLSSSSPVVISSYVGSEVLLPCSWLSLVAHLQSEPHVQWNTESGGPVLEQRGEEHWTSPSLSHRAEVSRSKLKGGDCSLTIRDVQNTDRGQYSGYLILDHSETEARAEARTETRTGTETRTESNTESNTGVFICSVKLLVFAHNSVQTKHPGDDLILDLFSPHSTSLWFQSSNGSHWRTLWQRGESGPGRVQKVPDQNQLRLSSVSESDQGFYKILDSDGLTVSTTRLAVVQRPPVDERHLYKALKIKHEASVKGVGVKTISSRLLLSSLLIFSVMI